MKLFITRTLVAVLASSSFFLSPAVAQVDTTIGVTTPSGSGGNYKQLAHALTDDLSGEPLKANAIYNWITHNISYDVAAMQKGKLKEEEVEKVFKQRKGMCMGYSMLFAAMCNEVGIKAIMIDGYSKDWMFDDGDKLYIPRHAWNVVYVDNKWYPVDATWGAGGLTQVPGWLKRQLSKASKSPLQTSGKLKFKFRYDTAYFLSDPLAFRLKHLPSDPVWQLTDTAMPLAVFEAGQIAIETFNKQYPLLAQNTEVQGKLSSMEERERVQAAAKRISAYNSRYHVAMAAKHQADAVDTITANAGGGIVSEMALEKVMQQLKSAEVEVAEQKKSITVEYTTLSSKNKTKNLQTKQYIQALHSDNKRMITQCESRIKRVGNLNSSIDKKATAAEKNKKKINAGNLVAIATAPNPESLQSAGLVTLTDSIKNRNNRIDSIKLQISQHQSMLTLVKEKNSSKLDSLADIFTLADSALIEETINRIHMHDDYDEEVLQWNRLVKTVRLQQVDSLQKEYFAGFDSVNTQYENLRKAQWEQMELYRNNLKDMERYKRKNDNKEFLAQYDQQAKDHASCTVAYYQTLATQKDYLGKHKELFNKLIKLYKRQEELAGYMEKSEEKRQELETKNLSKKEAFDKKENEKQKQQLKQTGQHAEKVLTFNK